mgnify:CR=1 FL=1
MAISEEEVKKEKLVLKKVSKLLTSGPMIAIAGIIATITIFVKGISKAFDENEELVEKLHEAYASFEPILKAFETTCKILAEGIIDLVNAIGRLYRAFAGTEEMYQKQIQAAHELADAEEALDKAKQQFALREEARNQEITELEEIVKDTELKSIDERIKAQKELNPLCREYLILLDLHFSPKYIQPVQAAGHQSTVSFIPPQF